MRIRATAVAVLLLASGVMYAPAAVAHNCVNEEPRCRDEKTLLEKPDRQEVISRVLGHHCAMDGLQDDPQSDKRVISSRIGVVFSDVTRRSGFFESFTIYFVQERQVMGQVDTYGKQGDVHKFDDQPYDPGYQLRYDINQRVEFGDRVGSQDAGAYTIEHTSAASRGAPNIKPDCKDKHFLLLTVTPPSQPPCQRPPCLPQ
jgi:hypothetical protein